MEIKEEEKNNRKHTNKEIKITNKKKEKNANQ